MAHRSPPAGLGVRRETRSDGESRRYKSEVSWLATMGEKAPLQDVIHLTGLYSRDDPRFCGVGSRGVPSSAMADSHHAQADRGPRANESAFAHGR
jgi:hypothetical protein